MKKIFFIYIIIIYCFGINFYSCNNKKSKSFTDLRDGRIYRTVTIGKQTWMAENLAFYVDTGCWAYNNEQDSVFKYGYLYNWKTAQNVCPDGWRLPEKKDFELFLEYIQKNSNSKYDALIYRNYKEFAVAFEGIYLDSTERIRIELTQNINLDTGNFFFKNRNSHYWTKSEFLTKRAWYLYVLKKQESIMIYHTFKNTGFAVRCIKED